MRCFFLPVALLCTLGCIAQSSEAILNVDSLAQVVIEANRATAHTPVAYTDLGRSDIMPLNNGQDMPYILRFTPSLVVTSDAGNGIGYTGLWIRGSDPSRINVTINGVPLNDPESQQVFWVDVPDLASSASGIQIQRGIGTSTQGVASFGGSVRINTNEVQTVAGGFTTHTGGSYGTLRNTIGLGTGLLNNNWSFRTRLSHIQSDGYIDRASTRLRAFHFDASHVGERTTWQAIAFGGHERTYQAWYGTPAARLDNDVQAMLTHAVNNGYTGAQLNNLLQSGRTYNYYLYDGEVDDYTQSNYQLHMRHRLTEKWMLKLTTHYTRGLGYFEQYRTGDALSAYGLNDVLLNHSLVYSDDTTATGAPWSSLYASHYGWGEVEVTQQPVLDAEGKPVVNAQGQTLLEATAAITRSDVVRRRWLDNHFYGVQAALMNSSYQRTLQLGAGASRYEGKHFGELVWMEHAAGSWPGMHYYNGLSTKHEAQVYGSLHQHLGRRFMLFADVQFRMVDYQTQGTDNDLRNYDVTDRLVFVNPKAGCAIKFSESSMLYASVARGGKEPNRNDYVDAPDNEAVLPEFMTDMEAGWRNKNERKAFALNAYYMNYRNQLVLNGALNDVGAPLRMNVPHSYRTGIEAESQYRLNATWNVAANCTYSINRIKSFAEIVYDYTNGFDEVQIEHHNTPISFSPSVIASGRISFLPRITASARRPFEVVWTTRYVSRQHLDNSGDRSKVIAPYLVSDAMLNCSGTLSEAVQWRLSLQVMNVLNALYSSNGYTYSYIYGERITERFYYPQAVRHFLLSASFQF